MIKKYINGRLLCRIGISFVFLWFGYSQLMHPENFVSWIPKEAERILAQPTILVILNGAFEMSFGLLLLIGVYTKIVALALGVHLALITASIGLTEIGVRDIGLTLATLSIALAKPDKLTVDRIQKKLN